VYVCVGGVNRTKEEYSTDVAGLEMNK